MPKFRKKPVIIEAERFTMANKDRVFNWVTCTREPIFTGDGQPALKITTLEGDMIANLGDWVIKGVKGEFYPCKDPIFRATYEPADEDAKMTWEAV